jgi:hypothetical protein
MKPNGPNNEVSRELLEQSYKNYCELKDKNGLVEIYKGWWEDGAFHTIMEYLVGYQRLCDVSCTPERSLKVIGIISNMIKQGYIDYDTDPTNFMVRDNDVKMIDLDKIMRIEDVCKDRGHYGSWFASRMCRMMRYFSGSFDPMVNYTKVLKV